jgi:hypothetical protein
MKKFIAIAILLKLFIALAQRDKINSLKKILFISPKEDSNKIKTLNLLSREFYDIGIIQRLKTMQKKHSPSLKK